MACPQRKGGEATPRSSMESTASAPSVQSSTPTSASEGARSARGLHPTAGLSVRWRCGARLAGGSYGCIYKAFNLTTGQIFAAKVLTMKAVLDGSASKTQIAERLAMLECVRHPNIVEHLGHEFADGSLFVYLEFVGNGSLASMLREFGPLRGPMLGVAAAGLMRGLDYLHSREPPVVHGDVTSSSILVGDGWRLQLQCFQSSRHVVSQPDFASLESLARMAPEVYQGRAADKTKADVWGAGCVIMEMATAERPWAGAHLDEIVSALGSEAPTGPPLPPALSPSARACAAACLSPKEGSRPSAAEMLRMPCLRDAEKRRRPGGW